jgi:hypothetical protein
MSLPTSRNRTYIDGVSQVPASDMNDLQDWLIALYSTFYAPGMFGDGNDGNLVFDGVATVNGLVPGAGVYTATRDIYANNCTVTGATTTLFMGPYRLYVKGTLTTAAGGKVSSSGNAGTLGGAGGIPFVDASVGGSVAGGASGANPGANVTNAYGGVGGGGSGGAAGSNGGTVTAPAASLGTPHAVNPLGQLVGGGALALVRGGSGGGGGQGGVGGGGGAGGGVLAIAARILNLAAAGDLIAAGGKGGDANPSNSGGGGGGGGGVLILYYAVKNAVTFSAATNCPGGAGGAKTGAGVAGSAGSNGTLFAIALG